MRSDRSVHGVADVGDVRGQMTEPACIDAYRGEITQA